MRLTATALFLLLAGLLCANSHAAEPFRVLIKNVYLPDLQGEEEDVAVDILITDSRLDVVTQDHIAAEEAEISMDAQSGYLLGNLDPGERPSFVILSEDPRRNLNILMNTKPYVRLAVNNGTIIKNSLPLITVRPAARKRKKSGWLSYEPPPMTVPLDYRDKTQWNRFESRYVSGLLTGALMLDRTWWFNQDAASQSQVGDLDDFESGELRAFRLGVVGTLNFDNPWIFTAFLGSHSFDKGYNSTEDDAASWFDYRLDIPFLAGSSLSIGKQKAPMSMERIMSLAYEPFEERSSVADAMLPARSVGVAINDSILNQRLTWAGGVFNDWLDRGESFNKTDNQFVGRITGVPFVSSDWSNLLHIGFGIRYANARQDVQYWTDPEVNQAPVFVDTGPIPASGVYAYNLEATWRRGPFWLAYEYIHSDVDSEDYGDLDFHGQHIAASWALTGEMRPYRRRSGVLGALPVAKSVNQGGLGAWEAAVRYSSLDLTDGPVDGGQMDIYTLGLNWWLTPHSALSLDYRNITLDRFGEEGTSNALTGRLTLILE